MSSNGNLFILSAPSGSGKTSLANRVIEEVSNLDFSISFTTRPRRKVEQHGKEYYFVSKEQFEGMIEQGAFLEWAHVYGNYYGTSREFVESRLEQGIDVLLDIDIQGALKVEELIPEAVMIFVLPPSFGVLQRRLEDRGLDDPAVIQRRLDIARREVNYFDRYQYVIINEEIEDSVTELKSVILASRARLQQRRGQAQEILQSFATGEDPGGAGE